MTSIRPRRTAPVKYSHRGAHDLELRRLHFSPSNLPVFLLRKCSLTQAGQMIPSYSFSRTSLRLFDQCWTFIDVVGHLKTIGAICKNMTTLRHWTMM